MINKIIENMAEDLEFKDMINSLYPHGGIPAAVSNYLPMRERFKMCDIATREESFIEGDLIHVFYLNNKFYCSQWFFDELLKLNGIYAQKKES